jgi:hypothetical protein
MLHFIKLGCAIVLGSQFRESNIWFPERRAHMPRIFEKLLRLFDAELVRVRLGPFTIDVINRDSGCSRFCSTT